jgi:sulfonate transport system permease protein
MIARDTLPPAGLASAGRASRPRVELARRLGDFGLALLLPVAGALLWELAARRGWIQARLMPPPSVVLASIADLWRSGELTLHMAATLRRVAVGFALGVAAATVLGALTGYLDLARRLLDPTIQAIRNIPSIAWVPLFILWFGIFEASKVILIAVGVFFPVYLGLMTGIQGVDRKLVEVGRIYHFGPLQMICRVLVPAALPAWLTGVRNGLGLGWMFVIAAELMGASEGLGYLLVDGQMTGNAAAIMASLVLFALLGKASDVLLLRLARPWLAWQDSFKPVG